MTDIEKLAAALAKHSPELNRLGYDHATEMAHRIDFVITDLGISFNNALGLIEGTHVVVPVEPTEAEIEQVARALAREDLGSNVDLSSCADEESDAEWTFYTVEARVAYKTVIAAIQGDL